MTTLTDYHHFSGRHWETGSLHNALAYQSAHAPRPQKPLSEAMLLGLGGGIAVGYFLFGYKGYPPQLALMTRNTFSPFNTILERLAAPQTLLQTANPAKAEANLLEALDSGRPALVWADSLSLPYNGLGPAKDMWMMWPLVVYGFDGASAWLADRSAQPLQVTAAELAGARGRVKKEKYRVLALELPDRARLPAAIDKALRQCIALYVDKPPRGTRDNFGLTALRHWAAMLTNTRNPKSWARFFPAGAGLWAAVIGAGWSPGLVGWIEGWGAPGADRGQYADFLDEAAALTKRPGLKPAAKLFRHSAAVWTALAASAAPDDIALLGEARRLLAQRRSLFIDQGAASLPERQAISAQLNNLRAQATRSFPLTEGEVTEYHARLAEQVLVIHNIESKAVAAMQAAMA
jgi:hypothetical protein